MKCPSCGHRDSRVLDSRPVEEESSIKRRRECVFCGKRFTTYEVVDTVPIAVVKRSGDREFFDKHKLKLGIERACQKRPVSYEEIENLVSEVESAVQEAQVNEISSAQIGEMIMEGLKGIDEVAYVRFASVYRQFKDINTFMSELETLLKEQKMKGDF